METAGPSEDKLIAVPALADLSFMHHRADALRLNAVPVELVRSLWRSSTAFAHDRYAACAAYVL